MNRKRLMVPKAPVLPHPNTLCLTFCGRWRQHILTGLLHKRGHTLGHKAQTLGVVLKKVLHARHGTLPKNGWTTNKQSATTKFTCAAPAPCHPHVTALPPLPHVTAPLAVPGASSFSRYRWSHNVGTGEEGVVSPSAALPHFRTSCRARLHFGLAAP